MFQVERAVILHPDDWEYLDELSKDPIGRQNFLWSSPKSKNVNYKVEHPVFSQDKEGRPIISYIDQFPEPKNMQQGLFLQKLSDALEESKKKQNYFSFTCRFNNFFQTTIFGCMVEKLLRSILGYLENY